MSDGPRVVPDVRGRDLLQNAPWVEPIDWAEVWGEGRDVSGRRESTQGRPGAAHALYSPTGYHEGPHTLAALVGIAWGRIRRIWG